MPEVAAPDAPAAPLTHGDKIKAGLAKKDAMKAALLKRPDAAPVSPTISGISAEKGEVYVAQTPSDFQPFAPPVAAVPDHVPGFLSWTEFCNRVSVEIVLNPVLYSRVGKFQSMKTLAEARAFIAKEPGPFYGIMRGAFLAMNAVHSVGAAELGKE